MNRSSPIMNALNDFADHAIPVSPPDMIGRIPEAHRPAKHSATGKLPGRLRATSGWTIALVALTSLASCGGSDPTGDDTPVQFRFRLHGHSTDLDFIAVIADHTTKAQARAQLALPEAQRQLHAVGTVAHSNGGYNLNWSWHFADEVTLAQVSIEACDTDSAQIEANLDYWVNFSGGTCPWTSYVYAELPP